MHDDTEPLYQTHDTVYRRTHVICSKPSDEVIESAGGRAYAEEERYFDENDHKPGDTGTIVSTNESRSPAEFGISDLQAYYTKYNCKGMYVEEICYPQGNAKEHA